MPRVLVFNFLAGVMDRGIPVYTSELICVLRALGFEVIELRCPAVLRSAPFVLLKLLFLVYEQLVAPIARLLFRCDATLYPYNSVSVVDSLADRATLVIHDLIPNGRGKRSFAGGYILCTQALHRRLGRPVVAASWTTHKILRRLPAFRRSPLWVWENPFVLFEQALGRLRPGPAQRALNKGTLRVVLCTGMGPYKDYPGALRLWRNSRRLRNAELRVVGFGDDAPLAARRVAALPAAVRSNISILPRLSTDELLSELLGADLVWVHSRKEGYGRFVVEGRLCGRPVVAADIPAFRALRDTGAVLYESKSFDDAVTRALSAPELQQPLRRRYQREALEQAILDLFGQWPSNVARCD